VPVVLLHYSKHQQRLLLEGGPKLEKRRTGILEERERKTEIARGRESQKEQVVGKKRRKGNMSRRE